MRAKPAQVAGCVGCGVSVAEEKVEVEVEDAQEDSSGAPGQRRVCRVASPGVQETWRWKGHRPGRGDLGVWGCGRCRDVRRQASQGHLGLGERDGTSAAPVVRKGRAVPAAGGDSAAGQLWPAPVTWSSAGWREAGRVFGADDGKSQRVNFEKFEGEEIRPPGEVRQAGGFSLQ